MPLDFFAQVDIISQHRHTIYLQ